MLKNKFTLFYCGVGIGILVIILTISMIEYAIRNNENIYAVKNKHLLDKVQNIQVLVLGSSHGLYGISASTISEHAFNLSNVSQGFNYDKAFLKKYINKMKSLKLVILPLSTFSMSIQLGVGPLEDYRKFYYKHFMHIVPSNVHFDGLWSRNFLQHFSLALALGLPQSIRDLCAASTISQVTEFGDYNAPSGDISQFDHLGALAYKRHAKPAVTQEVMQDLKNIKALLDAKGVKLLLVTTPTWQSYNKFYVKQDLEKFFGDILQELNLSTPNYYSAFYAQEHGYVSSDFHDPDHLSKQGAIKFSQSIKQYLAKHQDIFGEIN